MNNFNYLYKLSKNVCPVCKGEDFNTLETIEGDNCLVECLTCLWSGDSDSLIEEVIKYY